MSDLAQASGCERWAVGCAGAPQGPRSAVLYVTRSDLSWYSRNANAYQKPLMLGQAFDTLILCPDGTQVPSEIWSRCRVLTVSCGDVSRRWTAWRVACFVFGCWREVGRLNARAVGGAGAWSVATGFDVPCLLLGRLLKWRLRTRWWAFCWDPPAQAWRDRSGLLARAVVACVDWAFRATVRRADKLVLNSHPGLLEEVGYTPRAGQLVHAMNGAMPLATVQEGEPDGWMVGVLARGTSGDGFRLTAEAFCGLADSLPRCRVRWIGGVPDGEKAWLRERLIRRGIDERRFELFGLLDQPQAFEALSACGVLLFPYLGVPSLKWGYPLKLAEYFQLGRCVVAADTPGARAYVADQETGRLFQAGSALDLARVLREVLGNCQEQTRLGVAAKQRSADFDWATINRAIISRLSEDQNDGSR